jgi:RNA polymerase sigma factor (sigma-70 family)
MKAPRSGFDVATVLAAQRGEAEALHALLAEALPLVYNITGFLLRANADVDDVVQETMVRAVRGLADLRDPAAFRSWLVAVAIRQVHVQQRARSAVQARTVPLDEAVEVADPAAEFADLAALRLDLTGQQREVAEAAGWLDAGNRELLGLWWLAEHGRLDRTDLAAALGVPKNQAAVRIQRMKQQLSASRVVVRALRSPDRCRGLSDLTTRWDGHRNALWRKRFIGHTKDCEICDARSRDLVPVEKLLTSLTLAAVPTALAAAVFRTATAAWIPPGPAGAVGTGATATRGAGKAVRLLTAKTSVAAASAVAAVAVIGTAVWAGSGKTDRPSAPSPVAIGPATSEASISSPTTTPRPPVSPPSSSRTQAVLVPSPSQPRSPNAKKGVAAWSAPGFDAALSGSKAAWYYDWSPTRTGQAGDGGPEFVPMIWGAKNADAATLATVRSQGSALLGFNEPDMGAQSNMTVEQALDLWPKLQATGLRLGSPAVAVDAAKPGGWLDRFMAGAAARGYRVDFITVHWYGSDFRPGPAVQQLSSYLHAIHDRYHLPIWVTEYALISFSGGTRYPAPDQQAAFVTASAAMLDGLPYVERYAWFGLAASGPQTGTALFQDGRPTPMGLAYEAS